MLTLLRKFTDRPVFCRKCGEKVGYVPFFATKRWEHVDCPPYRPVRNY